MRQKVTDVLKIKEERLTNGSFHWTVNKLKQMIKWKKVNRNRGNVSYETKFYVHTLSAAILRALLEIRYTYLISK